MRAELASKRIEGLYGIIDTTLLPGERAVEVARQLLESGVAILQLRAKGLASGELLRLARRLKAMAHEQGALFIMNDRADIALASEADGVHLGQCDIPVEEARKLLGHDKLIGFSTHNLAQARLAEATTADYLSFGPIFSTTTKKNADPPLGIEALREARCIVRKPLVAIGGINESLLSDVLGCGVESVAIISCILKSKKPGEKAKELISKIKGTQRPL